MPNERPDQLSIDDSGPRVRLAVPAMTRVLALLVALILTVMITLAEDESRQNLSINRSVLDASGDTVARLEKKLEEAKGDAKGVEGLCKNGFFRKWKWSNAY